MAPTPHLLQAGALPSKSAAKLRESFTVVETSGNAAEIKDAAQKFGANIRAMTCRHAHLDKPTLELLPCLEIISSYSAGLDGIDLDAVRSRGIAVHNTSEVLAEDVADLALSLLLATLRGTVRGQQFVRSGAWQSGGLMPLQRSVRSIRVGIVGLGHVGAAVGRRLDAMGVTWGYSGPNRKPVSAPYFPEALGLAEWAQALIVTCPATSQTYHLIDCNVLKRLGSDGHVVNVSRGSIVDETALLDALARDCLAGVALDVFADEPHVPQALLNDPRAVLSPHMGSGTVETREQMGNAMITALKRHFGMNSNAG